MSKSHVPKALERTCPDCGARPHEHCRGFRFIAVNLVFSVRPAAPSGALYIFHDPRVHAEDHDEREPEVDVALSWSTN